jgi:predicted membrane protein
VHTRLYVSQIIIQIGVGTVVPIFLLAITQMIKISATARTRIYSAAGILTLIGIFAMRWNVVIGGQLFSKSFLGYTTYKMGFVTKEGLVPAVMLTLLPLLILWVLVKILPPWVEKENAPAEAAVSAMAARS